MNKILAMVAFAAVFCVNSICSKADEVDLAEVLGPRQGCDHVIDLVLRHGVNGTDIRSSQAFVHDAGWGPILISDADIGDLELMQVNALPGNDPACGPKFAVVVRNNSTREVCGLRVSAVALLGRICSSSPTAIAKVEKICAGESLEINVQLPIEALSMGNHNGTVVGFRRLLVAIDSFDQFAESNEANNIKVFDLASIPVVAATTNPEVATPVSTAVPSVQRAQSVNLRQIAPEETERSELQRAIQKLGDADQ